MDRDASIILWVVVFFAAVFVGGNLLNSISGIYGSPGMILPCDKVVIVTEKFQQAMSYGFPRISNMVRANGVVYPYHDNFALDGGEARFDAMPLNQTMILFGASDVSEGQYVSNYKVVNVVKDPSITNACKVV